MSCLGLPEVPVGGINFLLDLRVSEMQLVDDFIIGIDDH
jgi:hypothetical protein